MSDGNRPTVKEHFVPQTYLSGFSENSTTIYRFDLKRGIQTPASVPIKSVAYIKNLYELQADDNSFINRNFIEHCLCQLEGDLSNYRKMLESKAFLKENQAIECFLSTAEKNYWRFFITLQTMRDPAFISEAAKRATTYYGNTISPQAAKNLTLIGSFPFFESTSEHPTGSLCRKVFDIMCNMNIMVKAAPDSNLITSDSPVCVSATETSFEGITGFWMPITSDIAILFYKNKKNLIKDGKRNGLQWLSQTTANLMNEEVIYRARDELYSKRPFSESEIVHIKEIRKREHLGRSLL